MVDQAGAATAKRLEQGAAAWASLSALQEMMADVDQRAARLLAGARQINLVRAAEAEGLEGATA